MFCFVRSHKLPFLLFLFLSSFIITDATARPGKYRCVTEHYNTRQWMSMFNRELDSNGILIQNKQYHALSIAMWGIMNYHEYEETANDEARKQLINQYRYFCDTTHVVVSKDGKYMGLPYRFKFNDLEAPWYSGMTQGVALSYLYRYYDLTNDKTALVKMKQIAGFMIRMQNDKGTIGKTPEGYLWIEEYPNSKKSPQVLNGFINGLLGLAEYLEVFPGHTAARRIHDAAYNALIKTIHKYDTPTWTNYNRTNTGVRNDYMRYQITQMDHLLHYYGDSVFYRQMMIWSPMAVSKPDNLTKFLKAPRFQFAFPLDSSKHDGKLSIKPFFEDSLAPIPGGLYLKKKHYPETDSLQLPLKAGSAGVIHWKSEVRVICLGLDSIYSRLPEIWVCKDGEKWRRATVYVNKGKLFVQSELPFSKLRFKALKHKYRLRSVSCLAHNYMVPQFLFYKFKSTSFLRANQLYCVSAQTQQITQAIVFYRYADKKEKLGQQIWKQDQYVALNDTFTPPAEGYYEF